MQKLINFFIFCLVLSSFLANPAPQSLEIFGIILILLPFVLALLSLCVTKNYTLYKQEYDLFFAIMLYLSYLLISILIGILQNIPLLNILRASGPYINFFPLILLCFLPSQMLTIKSIAIVLIMVGIFQAGYQLFLYFNHNAEAFNTSGILRGRITFIEPRTTLPFVLSLAILPLAFFKRHPTFSFGGFFQNSFLVSLILIGFFAGVVTLTRSIILSVIFGWLIFFMFNLRLKLLQKEPFLFETFKRFFIYLSFLSITMVILSFIPKIQLLEQGLLTRFYQGEFTGDYSNGRIYEEWIPAITAWMKSGVFGMIFGIGAGNTFTVATGEERTYIHNLCIYNLLYGGIYGLLAGLLLYFTVFKVLIYRAFQSHNVLYIAFAALLGSIFFYGQLFAVHKGLAFNTMLFLIIALALNQPKIQNNSVYSYGA